MACRTCGVLFVLIALSFGCGGGGVSSPSPGAASLAGTWSGTFTPTDGITSQPQAATATFRQDGRNVTGQLAISQPPAPPLLIAFNGTVSGTSVSGIATMALFFCNPSGAVSGSIDNGMFRMMLPALHGGDCAFLSTGEFVLHR